MITLVKGQEFGRAHQQPLQDASSELLSAAVIGLRYKSIGFAMLSALCYLLRVSLAGVPGCRSFGGHYLSPWACRVCSGHNTLALELASLRVAAASQWPRF
jgi:hypothetical protein